MDVMVMRMNKELPSAFLDEGLVEAVLELGKESCPIYILSQDYQSDWCGVIHIRESSCLVSLFADHNVHSQIILTGLHSRSNGLEGNFKELGSIPICPAESADEVHVVPRKGAVAYKGEWLVAAFNGY